MSNGTIIQLHHRSQLYVIAGVHEEIHPTTIILSQRKPQHSLLFQEKHLFQIEHHCIKVREPYDFTWDILS